MSVFPVFTSSANSSGISEVSSGAPAGLLGIYAKCSSPSPLSVGIQEGEILNPGTGEVVQKRFSWDRLEARLERYALQAVARHALQRRHVTAGKGESRGHKTTRCRRWLLPRDRGGSGTVEIWRHRETHTAHFGGLEICGRVWACPVCSSRISSQRAKEIRAAVDQWTASGGKVFFVTLTVPHSRQDNLQDMVTKYRDALRRFRSGKAWDKLTTRAGFAGLIRAVEVTWGHANSWHPHIHELWLAENVEAIPIGSVIHRWQNCAERAGFERPSFEHGCKVEIAESTEQARARLAVYLTKIGEPEPPADSTPWGAADELAKAHAKRVKDGRFSPFDLLRTSYSDKQLQFKAYALELFADYVEAFSGIAQVFWTRGLKVRFDLREVTDEEAANEHMETADLLSCIEVHEWKRILAAGEYRSTVLELFERGGRDAFEIFLSLLPAIPVMAACPEAVTMAGAGQT